VGAAVPDEVPEGRIRVAATKKGSEKALTVPVERSGERAHVVLSMSQRGSGHDSLPDLAPGDELQVSAEVEVTTDCKVKQDDCVGPPYGYDPRVEARLLLADSEDASDGKPGHARVIDRQSRVVDHDRHHDVFVFDDVKFPVPDQGMPWNGPTFVNVAVSAKDRRAADGHVVLIGQNEIENGKPKVVGGMSGISVIRSRPSSVRRPEVIRTDHRRVDSIPVIKGETRVVYAQELKDLREGEQLVVKAEVKTSANHLTYPARVTLEVILAEDPKEAKPGNRVRQITKTEGEICPRNGKNCLHNEESMTSSKVGVLRIEKDAKQPLYVLVVLVTGDPLQKRRPGDELRIREGGSLRIFRFPPEMAG
jgi:hypothetical protein